jgi:Phosphotransferase enzyme family
MDQSGVDQLNLGAMDQALLRRILAVIPSGRFTCKRVDARSLKAIKVALIFEDEPSYFVKLDQREVIAGELRGYELMRRYVPQQNLPRLYHHEVWADRAALIYSLLDEKNSLHLNTYLSRLPLTACDAILESILIGALGACHWDSANAQLSFPDVPDLPTCPPDVSRSEYAEMLNLYDCLKAGALALRVPRGVIHGDLHSYNILCGHARPPVFIDFDCVQDNACIYRDYSKLELYSQLHWLDEDQWQADIPPSYALYPDAANAHASESTSIRTIRKLLWSKCRQVGLESSEVLKGYRIYLAYDLMKVMVRPVFPHYVRQRAHTLLGYLLGGLAR